MVGTVYAVVPDGSGGWYIGGSFTSVGGEARSRLAHIRPTGALDRTWSPSADGTIRALTSSGATLYVGGEFQAIGSAVRPYIAALEVSSGAPTPWSPNADDPVMALAVSNSVSLIYVGGKFTAIGGAARAHLGALDASSGLATAWNPGTNGEIRCIALSPDGLTVYAGGYFSLANYGKPSQVTRRNIAAFDATSGNVSPWAPDADGWVNALAVGGTKIYAGGSFGNIGGLVQRWIAAIDAGTGSVAPWPPLQHSEESDEDGTGWGIYALSVSGSTLYGGGGGMNENAHMDLQFGLLAALDTATGESAAWRPDPYGLVYAVAADRGVVYVGGSFQSICRLPRKNIAALHTDSGTPTAWDPSADASVGCIAVSEDSSTVYVGGSFSTIGGRAMNGVAALDVYGNAIQGWDPNPDASVNALAVYGGYVYLGGEFTQIAGERMKYLARLDGTTGHSTGWAARLDGPAYRIALSKDGSTVYVAGAFMNAGGPYEPRPGLAAFDDSSGDLGPGIPARTWV